MPMNPIWQSKSANGAASIVDASVEDHPRLRKALAPAFSERFAREQEKIFQKYIDSLITIIRKRLESGKPKIDLSSFFTFTTFDILVSAHPR